MLVAIVCWLPTCKGTVRGAACGVPPFTLTNNPCGEVSRVTATLFTTKFAVTVAGALGMVKLVLAEVAEVNAPPSSSC